MLKNIFTLIWLSFFIGATNISAKDIYVGPAGSATNNGTKNSPYNITKGIEKAESGDTVYLKGGTYLKSRFLINDKNNVTFKNIKGEWPIIDGGWSDPDQWPSWCTNNNLSTNAEYQALLDINNSNNIKFSGAEFRNSGSRLGLVNKSENIEISNVYLNTSYSHGMIILDSKNVVFKDSEVNKSSLRRYFGLKVEPCSNQKLNHWPAVVHTRTSQKVDLLRLYVHDSGGEGIAGWLSEDVTIDRSISADNWSNMFYINHTKNNIVKNNIGLGSDSYVELARQILIDSYNQKPNSDKVKNAGSEGIPMRDEEESNAFGGKGSENVQIFNNLIVGAKSGLRISDRMQVKNFDVHHNTVVGSRKITVAYVAAAPNFARTNSNFHHNIFWGSAGTTGTKEKGLVWHTNAWNKPPVNALKSNTDHTGDFELVNPKTPANLNNIRDFNLDNYKVKNNTIKDFGANIDDLKITLAQAGYKGKDWDGNSPWVSSTPNEPTPTPNDITPTPNDITPTPKYDIKYDLNSDGKVTIMDIIDVIKYVFQ
jgi:hypothetical protein